MDQGGYKIRESAPVMNRDGGGGYQLSHVYDSLITKPTSGAGP